MYKIIWCAGMPKLLQSDIMNLLCLFQELKDFFYTDIGFIKLYNSSMRKTRQKKKFPLPCKRLDKEATLKLMTVLKPMPGTT